MQPSKSLAHDMFLATISVVPAAIVWIALDRLYFGIALGTAIFLAAEYGYPALRSGRINTAALVSTISNVRGMIRSRATRGA